MKTRLTQDRLETLARFTQHKAEEEMICFAERGEISGVHIGVPETLEGIAWHQINKMFGEEKAMHFSLAQIAKIVTYASQKSVFFIRWNKMKNERSARLINALRIRKKLMEKQVLKIKQDGYDGEMFNDPDWAAGDPRAYGSNPRN